MLQSLHVKNLALIDEAEVDFTRGLNILSGETGAGKSIIIGSINLALGEKVQKEMLREDPQTGEFAPALVELVFTVENGQERQKLEALEVYPEDDQVILSRRIVGGRGTARVNGQSMPASAVREIAAILIDIHGQHEHQSLLSKRRHLEILDAYVGETLTEKKKALAETYRSYKKLVEEEKMPGSTAQSASGRFRSWSTRSVRSRRQDFGKARTRNWRMSTVGFPTDRRL